MVTKLNWQTELSSYIKDSMNDRIILHIDADNFYASVETVLNPDLANKPIVVCGNAEKRHGIVLAKNQIAREAGIKTGDTIWLAESKIKNLIKVAPNFKHYVQYSQQLFNIYTQYTPNVESFGLDECWLDITGCVENLDSGIELVQKIRKHIKDQTGLTVSIGISFSKIFAKIGSDMNKPDGVTLITRADYQQKIWQQNVKNLLYVGRHTAEKLNKMGIFTIGELARYDVDRLKSKLGKVGEKLYIYANGYDSEPVKLYTDYHIPESIGNGTTTAKDITNTKDASSVIFSLCEVIAFRLRQYELLAGVVSVGFRDKHLKSFSRQSALDNLTDSAYNIATKALELLNINYDFSKRPALRSITVQVTNLTPEKSDRPQSIFDNEINKNRKLELSIDKLRKKYGFGVLQRGITMGTIFTCDNKEVDDDFIPFKKHQVNQDEPEKPI